MDKYKGDFNINGEIYTLYTSTKSEKKAYHNFINQLIKKNIGSKLSLLNIFNGEKDNYKICKI